VSEQLNEGDLLTREALKHSGERLSFLITNGETEDVSIFRYEGVSYAYRLVWEIEGRAIEFHLEVVRVMPDIEEETVVERQFTERIEA
jgi:hypothetical protein